MLKEKCRKLQDQKIRELLSAYYTMQQGKNESVPDFAHRFSGVQHQQEAPWATMTRANSEDYINALQKSDGIM